MTITAWAGPMRLPATLRRVAANALAAAAAIAAFQATAQAQTHHNVKLHVLDRWKECSIQLDSSLTQAAWRQFAGEAGVVTYFRPLTGAEPMGRGKFEVSVLQWKTGIDDEEAAWNDTFVHPDSVHWLFEGDGLKFPGLAARAGVTDRTDVGLYLTKSPNANYGVWGVQLQQSLARDPEKNWAAAARLTVVSLYGPEDVDHFTYGVDMVVSRTYAVTRRAFVSPYAVWSTTLSRAHEKSAVVALDDQSVFGAQGTVGAEVRLFAARVAIEYGVGKVPSMSLKVGVGTRSN